MNIIDALNWRYAVRQFSQQRIDEEKINQLINATRLSATSYGLQPYRLIVVDDMQTRNKLMPYSLGQQKVVECSHLIVFAALAEPDNAMIDEYIHSVSRVRQQSIDELNGLAEHMKSVFANMSSEQKTAWAHQQVHIALGTMLSAAATMQIDSCPMGGIEAAGYDQVLGLGERGLETSVICALGIRHPDDHSASLEKVRYDQAEMVITI